MEAAGLAVGAVALVGLVLQCIDAFSLISTAKSFSFDYEISVIKLDMEKTQLLQWAQGVGLFAADSPERYAQITEPDLHRQLERVLKAIYMLITKSDDLVARYGLQEDFASVPIEGDNIGLLSVNRVNAFEAAYSLYQQLLKPQQKQTNLFTKTRWAVKDRDKFGELIMNVHEFVDALTSLVLVPRHSGDDLDRLLRIQVASHGQLKSLSDYASERIIASQQSTQDFRNIDEWLDDIGKTPPGELNNLAYQDLRADASASTPFGIASPSQHTSESPVPVMETPRPRQSHHSLPDQWFNKAFTSVENKGRVIVEHLSRFGTSQTAQNLRKFEYGMYDSKDGLARWGVLMTCSKFPQHDILEKQILTRREAAGLLLLLERIFGFEPDMQPLLAQVQDLGYAIANYNEGMLTEYDRGQFTWEVPPRSKVTTRITEHAAITVSREQRDSENWSIFVIRFTYESDIYTIATHRFFIYKSKHNAHWSIFAVNSHLWRHKQSVPTRLLATAQGDKNIGYCPRNHKFPTGVADASV